MTTTLIEVPTSGPLAHSLACAGVRPGMVVHDAVGRAGFQQAVAQVGATLITAAGLPVERQAALIRDLGAHVLHSTPSLAAQLADVLGRTELELGVFCGETWTPALRDRLESALRIKALDAYGVVATECRLGRGMHVDEDHFHVEVIDGELVIDGRRTGDLGAATTAPCPCGRHTARLHRLLGRRADRLDVDGGPIFPSQIEQVLLEQPGVGLTYQIVVGPRVLEVHCEPLHYFLDGPTLADQVLTALRERLGLDPVVVVERPGSLPRTPGKAIRVTHR